ncbi:MAG: metallo-mystery pair system four-Cys motif protein [Alphaproteobacteria bacterium]|nr:metallo-mystery pair system four-Cys motif protein [Alphaproteobacteria bacterium]MCB9695838.1 metallo-mystery pair system four-Cys motif protein [Alphaproteobacteria bacterium]
MTSLATVLLACGGSVSTPDGVGHSAGSSTTDTGEVPIELAFRATAGGVDFRCGDTVDLPSGRVTLSDLRFYVSEVALVDAEGREVPLRLRDDDAWQGEGVALMDFEDGSATCESGTAGQHTRIEAWAPAGNWDGLAFDLGLPFRLDHGDVGLSQPPLNVTGMFWSWQDGYKFLRVDLTGTAGTWLVHVGSSGCVSSGSAQAPMVECSRPNRARVVVRGYDPTAGVTVLELADLLRGADTGADTAGSGPGCMSAPADAAECGPVFADLGLDVATGECVDGCAGQIAFHGVP